MDYNKLNEEINCYLDNIKQTELFKKAKLLKEILEKNYKSEVTNYQKAQKRLNEALSYGEYFPGLKEIKEEYRKAKINLYSIKEFQEFYSLLNAIDEVINEDLNSLKDIVIEGKNCHHQK